jgi:ZIP family zinc transporter
MAVIVSNLPEGMASAAELGDDPDYTTRRILGMWGIVVCVSAVAAGLGAFAATRGTTTGAAAEAFAAGALLTMLTDDLIPEARQRGGLGAGLAAVLGFAVAFALHQLGA